MDSRIETLAEIILDRAKSSADTIGINNARESDEYQTFRRLEWLAVDMLTALHEYRVAYPEKY